MQDHTEAGHEIYGSFGLDSTSKECMKSPPALRNQARKASLFTHEENLDALYHPTTWLQCCI